MTEPRVVVACDFADKNNALNFIDAVDPSLCKLKVGKEMFTYFGPDFVKALCRRGFDVFLDLKFHDIPVTVAKACAAAADMGVWMMNVHASGGPEMMTRASQALDDFGKNKPLLIGVTVLTSMDSAQLRSIGISAAPEQQVSMLAELTEACGLDGVVCSAQEATVLRAQRSKAFLLVTPGIRPVGASLGDQKRVMTPKQAVDAGVDYLVIGRPITQSDDPVATLLEINNSL